MGATGNVDVGNVEWLTVDLVVHDALEQHAKMLSVHVGRRKDGFAQVRAGARVVIVLRQHAHLPEGGEYGSQQYQDCFHEWILQEHDAYVA